MAYLLEISIKCEYCHVGLARVALYDYRNELRGRYCKKCGKRILKEREKYERENPIRNG